MKPLDLKNPFGAVIWREEVLSNTFDAARVLAENGAPHGTVITADFQEAGRGRLARSWTAEKGKNLLFTILLKYGDFASIPRALTLKTGLAVSLAIEDLVPAASGEVWVKWPNDVMLNFPPAGERPGSVRKIAGILAESDGRDVYIGVGVNVAQREFPGEYRARVGSLAQLFPHLGEETRFVLLEKILTRLCAEIGEDSGDWRKRLSVRLYKRGETVSFAEGPANSQNLVTGKLSGIGPDGELLLVPENGEGERAFVTGELRVY